jgi:hypothetical protein
VLLVPLNYEAEYLDSFWYFENGLFEVFYLVVTVRTLLVFEEYELVDEG